MKGTNFIRGWRLLAVLILVITSACADQAATSTVEPATEIPVVNASLESGEQPVATSIVPAPSVTSVKITPEPSPIVITEKPSATIPVADTIAPTEPPPLDSSATPASSSNGLWISSHDKEGARTWIQFEIYSEQGASKLDVLEACVNYSCDYLGEIITSDGCSGDKSPKGIQIQDGKFMIDFHGILPEKMTHHSRIGMIYGQILDAQVITGTWIIPVCDYWMPLNVRYSSGVTTP